MKQKIYTIKDLQVLSSNRREFVSYSRRTSKNKNRVTTLHVPHSKKESFKNPCYGRYNLPLTSVIIFPLVLFLSLWLARFCFCCKTRSLVVRYSRANSLIILQNLLMLTSRIAYGGWPINNKNEWNLENNEFINVKGKNLYWWSLGKKPTTLYFTESIYYFTSSHHFLCATEFSWMLCIALVCFIIKTMKV